MQERASHAATCVMPGFSKDREALATHLANADALVHGCPFETFGLSIAEAMSCGLPCVVPDDGGANEMHDPGSGERYAAGHAKACMDATVRLLERARLNKAELRTSAAQAAARLPSVIDQFREQLDLSTARLADRARARREVGGNSVLVSGVAQSNGPRHEDQVRAIFRRKVARSLSLSEPTVMKTSLFLGTAIARRCSLRASLPRLPAKNYITADL